MMPQGVTSSNTLVGAILSRRYRLLSPLGEGGMGLVYAAESLADGRRVAIKILRPEFLGETQVRARFVDEARTCMRLSHPNILRVFEVAEAEDGSPYFVMELLEGAPLNAYMQPGHRLPVPQAVAVMQGVLSGLAAAHAQGVVHRDLKPENVFLVRDPSGQSHAKLLDFGIAKVMDVAGGMGGKTRTGMLLGTPGYMSPEQIRSSRDTDARSNLWSVGVLLYEMITGRQAFVAPTEFAKLAQVLGAQPEPVAAADPQLAPLQPFFDRALQKDRALRFQSAQEMSAALASATGSAAAATSLSRPPPSSGSYTPPGTTGVVSTSGPTLSSSDAVQRISLPAVDSGPGGTLSSGAGRTPSAPPPPQVLMVPPATPNLDPHSFAGPRGETKRAGVAPAVVALLVLLALGAGFLLGFAVGRIA